MIAYLDANIVIYYVERHAYWGPRVATRVAALRAAGDQLGVSDLHRLECLVGPLQKNDAVTLAEFAAFFGDPTVHIFSVAASVCERAARVRAVHRFNGLDSLHLAAAAENKCGLFLTNDATLARFPDVPVEVLT